MRRIRLNHVGYWSKNYDNCVTPEFLRGNIGNDKEKIVHYLKSGIRGIEFLGYARCRFECLKSETSELGNTDFTDGVWVWPEGLAHYVDAHNLLLPPEFLDHVRQLDFNFPHVDESLIKARLGLETEAIEVEGDDSIWKDWLKAMGEDDYLRSPVVVPKASLDRFGNDTLLSDWD
ncbi:hypothetical protein ONV78_24100 [Hahella sp. CR1]|uniref:hypothetical protein n=1 Tax=Hahella sp. CR1 TaxID=2992807 RepID=UPI00244110F1|nr:hypothetical protein [Hahella sp. CR1]MDG9670843.1 hypothetical protein [Hahella sp. CR1]